MVRAFPEETEKCPRRERKRTEMGFFQFSFSLLFTHFAILSLGLGWLVCSAISRFLFWFWGIKAEREKDRIQEKPRMDFFGGKLQIR